MELEAKIGLGIKLFDQKATITYDTKHKEFVGELDIYLDKSKKDKLCFTFSIENGGYYFSLKYDSDKKIKVSLKTLVEKIVGGNHNIPDINIDIANPKIFFYYRKEKKAKDKQPKVESKFLIGMGAGLDIDLKKLPLAGEVLEKDNAFKFSEVLAIYSKGNFTDAELDKLKGFPKLSKEKITEGFTIYTELIINGENKPFIINKGKLPKETKLEPKKETKKTEIKPLKGTISSKATWVEVDKKIGPVNLQRLGFAYENQKIVVLLDASMEMVGMGMQLMGCGLGFDLEWPPSNPEFYMDGMGLSYKTDTISVSGAFLHSKTTIKKEPVDVYNGAAMIKVADFSLAAIGSYAKVNNNTSLFVYGVFDGSIGGPAFFFVTGVAAGFGYNRRINLPAVEEVAEFPLVSLAMKPQKDLKIGDVLLQLESSIEIAVGDYWFAIGIKFTSFKIVESFVLLTVNLGTQVEFAILGMSKISWPPKEMSKTGPIAYVELAIIAHFGPDSDVISVDGLITSNSYVLSKDCKLTGGFAFYTWVSGEHAGDFVITLGGYHPKFIKPEHYPTVPRIGLHWKLSDNMMIRGVLYYALTPSAMMMGGQMEILFQTSVVRVHFLLWIDILVAWAPFAYSLEIGILLSIKASIKKLLVSIHINFELHAVLQIWGPPFSGKAKVDLNIYSFEIEFGDTSKSKVKPLEWQAFSEGFLPKKEIVKEEKPKSDKNTIKKEIDAIQIKASKGVIDSKQNEGDKKDPFYIVNPQQAEFTVETAIPVKKLVIAKKELSATLDADYKNKVNAIGVRPCSIAPDDLDIEMEVNLIYNTTTLPQDNFDYNVINKSYPVALWGAAQVEKEKFKEDNLIKGIVSGVLIKPIPNKDVVVLKAFDFSTFLLVENSDEELTIYSVKTSDAYNSYDVYGNTKNKGFIKSYNDEKIKQDRTNILEELKGFDSSLKNIDEENINETLQEPENYFRGIPLLCDTGKLPQYPKNTNA